jgi:hypothetical protein
MANEHSITYEQISLSIFAEKSFSTATPDCDSYGRRADVLSAIRQASPTIRTDFCWHPAACICVQ